jgi:hypothetical protein
MRVNGRHTALRRFVAGGSALWAAATACGAATEPCAAPVDVTGTWSYSAEQQSPAPATSTGTLVVSRQTCRDFEGALDLVQVDARGQQRLAGRVSGRVIDNGSLQFDASLGVIPRQHLATLTGDSFAGSWLELGGAVDAAGAFHGKREVRP